MPTHSPTDHCWFGPARAGAEARPAWHSAPRDEIEIVDAKYKSHFADLDATRWSAQTEEIQSAMRADIHQVLAYAATIEPTDNIRATLVYPVRPELFEALALRERTVSQALIFAGRKQVTLCLRALAFAAAT